MMSARGVSAPRARHRKRVHQMGKDIICYSLLADDFIRERPKPEVGQLRAGVFHYKMSMPAAKKHIGGSCESLSR